MPRRILIVEWNCRRDNSSCVLESEGGHACRNSLKHGTCPRPIPRDQIDGLMHLSVARQRQSANSGQVLATGTN